MYKNYIICTRGLGLAGHDDGLKVNALKGRDFESQGQSPVALKTPTPQTTQKKNYII